MRELVNQAVFGTIKKGAQEKIKRLARRAGIQLSSTQKLYEKIAKDGGKGFTVPAFNIRSLTFDAARALFRAVKREKAGAFIVELAKSEMDYTGQSPAEYTSSVLAAGVEEKFKGVLFFQGDHFQVDPKKYFSKMQREKELKELEGLIKKSIRAGFYNIDIDCSSLSLEENFSQTARFTNFIRRCQPEGLTVSIGGEVGEIGGENTTIEELQEFIEGYHQQLRVKRAFGPRPAPIIKVAVQTGTSHGKAGKMDFQLLKLLSARAREYGLAGVVQHGASTLAEEEFKKFPEAGALEIHLATEFQNIILQSPYFPKELKEKVTKSLLGKFKKEIWSMPQKNIDKICQELEEKFIFFFKELNVSGTTDLIKKIYP